MKKILTIISLFVSFCVSAQAQTLTTFAEPGGTANPIINSITLTPNGALVAGSFTRFNSPLGSQLVDDANNIALVSQTGVISAIGSGITDGEVISTIQTSDGTYWAATDTTLWKYGGVAWEKMPIHITSGNIKKCFGTKTNDIILLGNLNEVSGTSCQNVIRFNAATQTLDTLGLNISLGNVSTQNDEGNFVALTQNDSAVFFTWQDYVTSNFNCLYKYDLYTNTASLMSSAPQMFYPRVLAWSTDKSTLYYFGLGMLNRYLWTLTNGQWNQTLLFDQDVTSMAAYDNKVYFSGGFSTVNGQSMQNAAVLDETTSSVTSWNIGISSVLKNQVFFTNGKALASNTYTLVSNLTPTGINLTHNNMISISPNPAQAFCVIKGIPQNEEVLLLNILGNIISTQTSATDEIIFNTQHLTPGIYFLKGKNFTKKVLFQ